MNFAGEMWVQCEKRLLQEAFIRNLYLFKQILIIFEVVNFLVMESKEYKIAKGLLEIEAVKLSPEKPFIWASGLHSPIYCDNRKALSYPDFRRTICMTMVDVINAEFKNVDVIAGVATGAIAYGALVAEMLGKPFVYVRSKAKDHGMGNQVEGVLHGGENVVVIEDLISTGKSSLEAVDALLKCNVNIAGMVAIFSYNFTKSRRAFENANVVLHTLSNYDALIDVALGAGYVKEEDMAMLREWRFDPEKWSSDHE